MGLGHTILEILFGPPPKRRAIPPRPSARPAAVMAERYRPSGPGRPSHGHTLKA